MPAMRKLQPGFTLFELLIVLAVAAIILAVGAPSFADFQRNSRLTAAANDLLGTLQTARTEAIKRQGAVAVCASDNPESPGAACNGGNFRGWISFVDTNNNCVRDNLEQVVRVGLRFDAAPAGPLTPVSNGRCISFAASGFTQTLPNVAPVSNVLFCDDRGNAPQGGERLSAARGVGITVTGRSRVTRDVAEIGSWAAAIPGVACPGAP